ncbi:Transmembrane protein 51 [Oryzias melastigma]|uniref:Transmembrane protein 51 n=1 Tax=Oryzias melastigma TaxID=30732 RepID=A0A834CGS0_ORYME|nr:Transmembrane protein 51 [Oryzias melastigma]
MCSSRSICGGNSRPRRSGSSGAGAHYALCALGVGLIALGVIMIVWTVMPADMNPTTAPAGNSTQPEPNPGDAQRTQSSSVALVLVGVGLAMLLLSICLSLRSKRRAQTASNQAVETGGPLMGHVPGHAETEAVDSNAYSVPSYDEVVGSNNFPVRQSNLRQSTSQLPSYEDIIAAVENEGRDQTENPPPADSTPAQPASDQDAHATLTANTSLPTRSSSRASRILRPLRVRRIKSDKLHLKELRLQIRTPTQNPVTIEPITPPPQYENKMPELQ